MAKYICSICGYEYNEAAGDKNTGIPANTKFEDIHADWVCPLCAAPKIAFNEKALPINKKKDKKSSNQSRSDIGMSLYEMSALCSNLAKGCEKQFRLEEMELFNQLAEYFKNALNPDEPISLDELREPVQYDLDSYSIASDIAQQNADRGALRALVWSEKVTKIMSSLLLRYGKQGDDLLEDKNIYVCEICGFIYLGNELPQICPVCKVPNFKMTKIARR